MTLNAACEDRSCQKELGLSSLWRIAAVGLDDTSQPLTHSYPCMFVYVYTQQGEFTREGSRLKGCKGNLLSRMVHQGRARQISRPTRVSDSSGSRTIVKIHARTYWLAKIFVHLPQETFHVHAYITHVRVLCEKYRYFTGTATETQARSDRVGKIWSLCIFIFNKRIYVIFNKLI